MSHQISLNLSRSTGRALPLKSLITEREVAGSKSFFHRGKAFFLPSIVRRFYGKNAKSNEFEAAVGKIEEGKETKTKRDIS